MADPKPCLIVILGATCTGKTEIAISLAQELNAPIISADSRQVYTHFTIGTAKPSLAERKGIPHYLLDVVPPDYNFTVAEYQQRAQTLIRQFHAQGISPILVGGTGLYIQSIVAGLRIPQVPPQLPLRQQLSSLGQAHCYQLLQQCDPATSQKIHPHDHHRTLRALEVFYVTGKPLSHLQKRQPPPYPVIQIGINCPPLDLYRQRISQRLHKMLERGWLEEINTIQAIYGKNLPLLTTIGYAEMTDYLAGIHSLDTALAKAVTSTYQFGKRQRTWFRPDTSIHWIDYGTDPKFLLDLIHNREDRQVHTHDDTAHHAP
jgi:tRNA dimethylallyltransferase